MMQRLLAMKQARLALIRELYTPRHPHLYTFSEVCVHACQAPPTCSTTTAAPCGHQ
jgi:hypothetical protein